MSIVIFLFGLAIGSFTNVLIYRLPREESIVFPGSHCPNCNHELMWYDNIPLISYFFLKGKCRYCKEKISIRYPLLEFFNGIIYLSFFITYGFTLEFIYLSLLTSFLISITIIDLKHQIIPDGLVVSVLGLNILYKIGNYFMYGISFEFLDSLFGLLAGAGIFLLILLISRGGMGGGDVTLVGALGFSLGLKNTILMILLSFIIGAVISIILLVFKIKSMKDPIPFGPFIIVAFYLSYFFSDIIISFYFSLFI
ncbi:prepilin peptidase [Soehngenia longivitae]|uniref:Prepilin leader peptidase/N-methyltransferase n=1 Tax=Soehngenia longivitae TaxID=2562294 RepID=A0A4Z0D727_9FIRM|nr:A24 family peptidase [Soehngenia longivitae]TFZ40675.1 prepilin peptidase [Soehngenia longivitae]